MGTLLSWLSNRLAYGGNMVSGKEEVAFPATLLKCLQNPIVTINVIKEESEKRLDSYSHLGEARLVVQLLEVLKRAYAPSELQVLSPYNSQITLLTGAMWQWHPDVPAPLTVRHSQGSEYPVVILTLAHYSPDQRSFSSNIHVMNVAVS